MVYTTLDWFAFWISRSRLPNEGLRDVKKGSLLHRPPPLYWERARCRSNMVTRRLRSVLCGRCGPQRICSSTRSRNTHGAQVAAKEELPQSLPSAERHKLQDKSILSSLGLSGFMAYESGRRWVFACLAHFRGTARSGQHLHV